MSELWLDNEEREQVRAAIDRFEWKHSWHLPKYPGGGGIDWHDPATLAKCREVLEEYRTMCLSFAVTCDRLAQRIASIQEKTASDSAES